MLRSRLFDVKIWSVKGLRGFEGEVRWQKLSDDLSHTMIAEKKRYSVNGGYDE